MILQRELTLPRLSAFLATSKELVFVKNSGRGEMT